MIGHFARYSFDSRKLFRLAFVLLLASISVLPVTAKDRKNHARCWFWQPLFQQHEFAACTDIGTPADVAKSYAFNNACHAHEEKSYNFCYSQGPNGCHASHHSNPFFCSGSLIDPGDQSDPISSSRPPDAGSPGSQQYLAETWIPNDQDDHILVTLQPETYFQVDLSELNDQNPLVLSWGHLTATGDSRER